MSSGPETSTPQWGLDPENSATWWMKVCDGALSRFHTNPLEETLGPSIIRARSVGVESEKKKLSAEMLNAVSCWGFAKNKNFNYWLNELSRKLVTPALYFDENGVESSCPPAAVRSFAGLMANVKRSNKNAKEGIFQTFEPSSSGEDNTYLFGTSAPL
ncbi:hypothetical protein TNCV_2022021 [Trichonephila clavipes]|nr:hypothetical protein TNCV_2022021 [Trichonephila clavipes]